MTSSVLTSSVPIPRYAPQARAVAQACKSKEEDKESDIEDNIDDHGEKKPSSSKRRRYEQEMIIFDHQPVEPLAGSLFAEQSTTEMNILMQGSHEVWNAGVIDHDDLVYNTLMGAAAEDDMDSTNEDNADSTAKDDEDAHSLLSKFSNTST